MVILRLKECLLDMWQCIERTVYERAQQRDGLWTGKDREWGKGELGAGKGNKIFLAQNHNTQPKSHSLRISLYRLGGGRRRVSASACPSAFCAFTNIR